MLRDRQCAALALLWVVSACRLAGQNAMTEFWSEGDLYVNFGLRTRLVAIDSLKQDVDSKDRRGSFSYLLDFALKPVFRRELRGQADVFRQRYLSFRAGYQYRTTFVNGQSTSENRVIAQSTTRFKLPGKFVVLDRNGGDFRFVKGKPFSMRYRNRLWLERDFAIGRFVFTPYVYDEIFYNTSKSAWVPNRVAFGVQVPAGTHVVLEPYILQENNRLATVPHVHALGFKFNLYF